MSSKIPPTTHSEKWNTSRANRQFQKFVLVGIVGFIIDASILTALMSIGYDPIISRFASFSSAVSVTWVLNKGWSFKSEHKTKPEGYFIYMLVQVIGAGINFSIFGLIIKVWPIWKDWPIVPLAIAAFFALIFNFLASRKFAFNSAK